MRGWRYESHRHALAARGISSRKYMAQKRYFMTIEKDKGPAMLADHKANNLVEGVRAEEAGIQRSKILAKFRKAEDAGEIDPAKVERFMEDDYKVQTEDYLNGRIDRGKYIAEVNRLADRFIGMHGATTSPFGWAKKEGEE